MEFVDFVGGYFNGKKSKFKDIDVGMNTLKFAGHCYLTVLTIVLNSEWEWPHGVIIFFFFSSFGLALNLILFLLFFC